MKLMNKIKKLNWIELKSILLFIILFPVNRLKNTLIKKKTLILIMERKDEARDNGAALFNYVETLSLSNKIEVYYVIDKKSSDCKKLKNKTNIIQFGSWKHFLYTALSTKYVSSQLSSGFPSKIWYKLWLSSLLGVDFYFLQHGVTQNFSNYLQEPSKKVKAVFCVSSKEEEFFRGKLGYNKNSCALTGFPRYDLLHREKKEQYPKKVLIMLTWRKYLEQVNKEEFMASLFYKKVKDLLSHEFVNKNKDFFFELILHPGLAKFEETIAMMSSVPVVQASNLDFTEKINSSDIFITDYSSLAFDFAYLGKKIFYYQFDQEDFRKFHLQEGYFNYVHDGFGPIFETADGLYEGLQKVLEGKFDDLEYKLRAKNFFEFHDNENSARVMDWIIKDLT